MKYFIFLFTLFIAFASISQNETDSLLINFDHFTYKNENCCKISSYNNIYAVPKIVEDSFYFKNYSFIQPVKQAYKNILSISSFNHIIDTFPSFEYPCEYLYEISEQESKKLRLKTKIVYGIYCTDHKEVYTFNKTEQSIDNKIDSSVRIKIILHDTTYAIQNIVDGVYVKENKTQYFIDTAYFNVFPDLYDSIDKAYKIYNQTHLQKLLMENLSPFYMSDFEISNYQYKEFLKWVKDSIALHLIYDSIDNDNARFLLNVSKREAKKLDPNNKAENLKKYGMNYEMENYLQNSLYFKYTKSMYYPMPERYFNRTTIDYTKLAYRKKNGEIINIYPDTLATNIPVLFNMYYWHTSYDNYPIHSISYEQASAYCEWLQNQWNKRFIKKGFQMRVEIPSLFHYEMALKFNQPVYGNHIPENQKNSLYSTTIRDEKDITEYLISKYQTFINLSADDVRECDEDFNMEFLIRYNNWFTANQSYPISHLNGNVSEYCSTPVTKDLIGFYQIDTSWIDPYTPLSDYRLVLGSNAKMDVIDLKGNQINALFYKQLVHKDNRKAFYGFRPIFYLYPVIKE